MSDDRELSTAERVRSACIEAARAGYQDAAIAGLCAEGALEAALGAIDRLDLRAVLTDASHGDAL